MALELLIVTPEGERFSGPAEEVVLPGSEGDFGVLPEHERFLTPLRFGALEIRANGGERRKALADGFADVSGDRVVVLADTYEPVEEIDVAAVQRERDSLRDELQNLSESEEDQARRVALEASLARAEIRIEHGRS